MTNNDLLTAKYYAAALAEEANAAYWSDNHRGHLVKGMHEYFAKIADAMGYDVVRRLGVNDPAA